MFFFFPQYTPAIDIWSIGCIFAELLTGKALFPGKNVVHQLDLMTDLLGTPSAEAIARVCLLWLTCSLHGFEYVIMHHFSVACPHPFNDYFCWTVGIIWTGTQREGSEILEQHEEEEAHSLFPEVPKCRSTCTLFIRKNAGIWTQGSTYCWRGKIFMPLHLTFYNIYSLLRWHIVFMLSGSCWSIF